MLPLCCRCFFYSISYFAHPLGDLLFAVEHTRPISRRAGIAPINRIGYAACAVESMNAKQDGVESSANAATQVAQKWPDYLWIVRHGQSAGNLARDAAEAGGQGWIDIETRDMDTPLSTLGIQQSDALAAWFAQLPAEHRPHALLCSPYIRARQTAERVHARLDREKGGNPNPTILVDERLREKEFGILDRLTHFGIEQKYPELSTQRAHVGKFYFRPPGGESWCDVILRLRSLLEMIAREYSQRRVLIVAHQVIVNCCRYLFERLDEQKILDIDGAGDVPNCGITSYTFDAASGGLRLDLANFVAPLQAQDAPITAAPDQQTGAKA